MIPKEDEQPMGLDVPYISPKTSSEQLKSWSKQRWPSESRKHVAADIVKNAKELLVESNIDWELVLGSIRIEQLGNVEFGEDAIAASDARIIGGLGAVTAWPMHRPAMVYLSVKCLADRVKSGRELEDFKRIIWQSAVDYGQKVLPHANLYIETLDFLLGVENRRRHRNATNKLELLLGSGNIEGAYKMMRSRDDLVRRRGPDISNATISSIRTPPSPGI